MKTEAQFEGMALDRFTERLLAAFLNNEPEAIRRIADWARQVAHHRAWGFESPEDIVQATLLALVGNIRAERFRGGNLKAYVQRTAKNLCVSSYRRARVRRGTVSLEHHPESVLNVRVSDGDPESRLDLQEVLQRLDEACRRLIDQAYRLDMSRLEIAGRLEISEGAVRAKLFRCLQAARRLARETDDERRDRP